MLYLIKTKKGGIHLNCLIINGTPHKGNTWVLVSLIQKQMEQLGNVTFDEVHLADTDIPFCIGCFACFEYGEQKCPHSEKVQPIAQKIEAADCLIFASSTYSLALTALSKNFIDHMSYNFHRPRLFTKKALVVASTAGGGAGSTVKYIRDILKHWGFNRVYGLPVKSYSIGDYHPPQKVVDQCTKTSALFYNDVASGKLYRPTLKRLMFYNVWRAMTKYGAEKKNADYRYWHDTGLYMHPFSEEVHISIIEKGIGNLLFRVVTRSLK